MYCLFLIVYIIHHKYVDYANVNKTNFANTVKGSLLDEVVTRDVQI